MIDLFEQLTAHLTSKQIGHWSSANEKAICVDFPNFVGFYRVYARINSEEEKLSTCGQARLQVPDGRRAAAAELLELAKLQQATDVLELDHDRDELRFYVTEQSIGEELSGEMVDRMIDEARSGVDKYFRAMLCMIFGNEQPADALRYALSEQRSG